MLAFNVNNLKNHLDQVDSSLLKELGLIINQFVERSNDLKNDQVSNKLYDYICAQTISKEDEANLVKLFTKNWMSIKEKTKITKAFMRYFESIKDPMKLSAEGRGSLDSRYGNYFQDKFYIFLKCYLLAKAEFLDAETNEHIYELYLNKYVPIQSLPRSQQPDILIHDRRTKNHRFVIELKKSFTKRSIKHYHQKEQAKWMGLSGKMNYFIVIFSCSESKYKVFSQPDCKIICCGPNKRKDIPVSMKIKYGVEMVFEDVFEILYSDFK